MKHPRKITRAMRSVLQSHGYRSDDYLLVKNTPSVIEIISRENFMCGKRDTIRIDVGKKVERYV